jgi:hypothetical protein
MVGVLRDGRGAARRPIARADFRQQHLGAILTIAALTVVPLLMFAEPMLDALSVAVPDPRFGSLLSAVTLFFVPTFFSGMVSPYAVRLLVEDRRSSGRHAGQLYFVSTFGSAAGTLLTSFYLVLLLEVNQILLSLLLISVAIGVIAWLVHAARNETDQ